MPATCKGTCKLIKMPKPKKIGGFYRNGFKRCSFCDWWAKIEQLQDLGYDTVKCPCCKRVFKSKPNKKEFKEKIGVTQ